MTRSGHSKTSKWETTMSTNDPKEASGKEKDARLPNADDLRIALPLGLPDPAVLARMATEFFTSAPEFAQSRKDVPAAERQSPSVSNGAAPVAVTQNMPAPVKPPGT